MDEILRQMREKTSNPYMRAFLLAIVVFLSLLGLIALIGGVGFSEEVEKYRFVLLIAAALLSVSAAFFWLFYKRMGWSKYHSALLALREKIYASPEVHGSRPHEEGGFRPHIVIGINHGGAIVGGLLYYLCNRAFHFATVWMYDDWKVHQRDEQKDSLTHILDRLSTIVNGPIRILLVDDSFKSGSAMAKARALVTEVGDSLKKKEVEIAIKTAVIVYRHDLRDEKKGPPPDYYVYQDVTHFPYGRV